jgi:ABC-type branched-subunit amino acid transport system substrate-binding protein
MSNCSDSARPMGTAARMVLASARGSRALPFASLGMLLCACVANQELVAPADAIHIGTVLPFSGDRAASGVALESAMRLAVDQVNQAGFDRRPLWLDVRDSHSDDVRGTANALALIDSVPMPFFVGTEEPTVAFQLTSTIKAHQMVHLMPGLTTAKFHDPAATAAWFRLSPSTAYVACALAKHMLKQGITRANLVVDMDDYSNSFATKFGQLFTTKGGTMLPAVKVDAGKTSYAETLTLLQRLGPQGTALITSPSVAAGFLQEWAVRGKPMKVFLGPTLNNPELVRNVPAGVLSGMAGVSADLGDQAAAFERYLADGTGAIAVAGVHYYYDAIALLALAAADAIATTGALPSPSAMKRHMVNVTSPGGIIFAYDQLPSALAAIAARHKIQYRGAAGFYVLNDVGDSTLNRGAIWRIAGDRFDTVHYEQCEPSELQAGGLPGTEF